MAGDDAATGGGMTAQHAAVPRGPYRVAPTDGTEKFNAIRIPLVPVACWRLSDPAFAFDSSFVGPAFAPELAKLAALVAANAGCPASIFAHADPVGSDDVNKTISDRRAIAIYAALTRQPDKWEELYSDAVDGDTWGTRAVQTMLATLKDGSSSPYYEGAIDGVHGPNTTDATKRFQGDAGLNADGQAGPSTRKVLFGAYMDAVCADSSGARFTMKPEDFLGGGADPGGKMAMQGCSRFNPVVLLPSSEEDSTGGPRNADNAPNRRVLIFLFRPRKTEPAEWPCPRVKESAAACSGQFWPDGEQRRKNGEALRLYKDTRDTMACRFYDRFARRSPCEGKPAGLVPLNLRLLDVDRKPEEGVPCMLTVGSKTFSLVTDPDGLLRVRVPSDATAGTLVIGAQTIVLAITALGAIDSVLGVQQRLNNLAYDLGGETGETTPKTEAALKEFQADAGLEPTGQIDGPTCAALRMAYGS